MLQLVVTAWNCRIAGNVGNIYFGFGRPRSKVAPQDLAQILPKLCPRKGSPEAQALEAAEREEEAGSRETTPVALAAADMQQLKLVQQRHARLFEQQRQRVR